MKTVVTLQQYLPLAVLKLEISLPTDASSFCFVATVLTACGIETCISASNCAVLDVLLQQYLPLAVLKRPSILHQNVVLLTLQQYLPLAVLKLSNTREDLLTYFPSCNSTYRLRYWNNTVSIKATDLISLQQYLPLAVLKLNHSIIGFPGMRESSCNSTYRLRYWNLVRISSFVPSGSALQQYLPLAVLKLSNFLFIFNRPSFMLQQYLPLAVLKLFFNCVEHSFVQYVATVLTACGIET